MGALLNARDKLQILMPHLTCVDYLMAAATANGEQGQTDDYQVTFGVNFCEFNWTEFFWPALLHKLIYHGSKTSLPIATN